MLTLVLLQTLFIEHKEHKLQDLCAHYFTETFQVLILYYTLFSAKCLWLDSVKIEGWNEMDEFSVIYQYLLICKLYTL